MKYVHPRHYKGTSTLTEHGQNVTRNMVEEYCLKCDKFMGKDHDFSECQINDKRENGNVVKEKTCPFKFMSVPLFEPIVKCEIENE